MKSNVIKFTVNAFTSLENIMKQVNSVAEGKIIDGIFVERKSFFKSEVEILVSSPTIIRQKVFVDKPVEVIKEVIKEVVVFKEVPTEATKKVTKKPPTVKYKENASSKYRGVTKNRNRFEVSIMHNKKRKFIGSFSPELDAARAYNQVAKELKGDKVILNVIEIDTPVAN